MKHILFLLPWIALCAQENVPEERVPPEQIEAELNDAEAQFDHALKLFNPWYTGPLLTPSATMVPPGHAVLQPYLFVTDNYAVFNSKRHSVSVPSLVSLKVQPIGLGFGTTPSMDGSFNAGAVANWKKGESGGGWLDTSLSFGFLIQEQTLYIPKAKFTISQSFPTGAYKNLSSNGLGLNGTGSGS